MNTKASWIVLALVLIGVVMVPIIPNDTPIDCPLGTDCNDAVGYVSLYDKYISN